MTLRRASAALVVLTALVGCAGLTVTVQPGPNSMLTAVVGIETDGPSRPRLVATADGHRIEVPVPDRARLDPDPSPTAPDPHPAEEEDRDRQ